MCDGAPEVQREAQATRLERPMLAFPVHTMAMARMVWLHHIPRLTSYRMLRLMVMLLVTQASSRVQKL